MSMNLRLHTLTDADIDAIVEQPLKLDILYYGEPCDPAMLDDLDDEEKDDVLHWKPGGESVIFYVEGRFQALHYLLTGETEGNKGEFPLNFLDGKRLDIGEIGWGKVHAYPSADVKEIAQALNSLDHATVKERYSADFFNQAGIYPGGYTWRTEDVDSLMQTLKELTAFINEASGNNLGIYRVLV